VKVVFRARAVADIERLRSFLEEENPIVANRVVSVLNDAAQSLSVFPNRGRPSGPPGFRELIVPFGRSAYVLRYIHLQDIETVLILRVWHGREDRNT
jgi:plasmid stabilization system protein ParE